MAQNVGMLWKCCFSNLVGLVFEGSIPTCTCFHSEKAFVACSLFLVNSMCRPLFIEWRILRNPHINRYMQCSCNHTPVASHEERTTVYNTDSVSSHARTAGRVSVHTLISPTSTSTNKSSSISLDDLHCKASADQDQGNRSFPEVLYQIYCSYGRALDVKWLGYYSMCLIMQQSDGRRPCAWSATSTNFGFPIDRLKNREYFGGWGSLEKIRRDSTTLFAAILQVSAHGT